MLRAGTLLVVLGCAAPAVAADRPGGSMQSCTQIWLERRDAGKVEPYKPFLRQCLVGQGPVQAKPAAVRKFQTVKSRKTAGAKPSHMPNRMKVCGAKWQQMKVDGTTNGQTWRQFSSECLKR